MSISHISRFRTIGDVAYTGVEADVLWPDALPDANPTYSWCCFGVCIIDCLINVIHFFTVYQPVTSTSCSACRTTSARIVCSAKDLSVGASTVYVATPAQLAARRAAYSVQTRISVLSNPAHWPTELSGVDADMVRTCTSTLIQCHRTTCRSSSQNWQSCSTIFLCRSTHLEQYTVVCSICFVVAVIQDRTKETSLYYTTFFNCLMPHVPLLSMARHQMNDWLIDSTDHR